MKTGLMINGTQGYAEEAEAFRIYGRRTGVVAVEELAAELSLATVTVSKRWGRVYERVQDTAPELFPAETHFGTQKRGPERRRHLLHSLRHHLEELRPILPLSPFRV